MITERRCLSVLNEGLCSPCSGAYACAAAYVMSKLKPA